jgi:nucleoside 2-deoxyribosyltransferase
MRKFLLSVVGVFGVIAFLAGGAAAKNAKYRKVPGAKGKALEMRTITYNGSTNGRMVIEVTNTGKTKQSFDAAGLYFVPGGDPEKAPQRLGAAGPFEVVTKKGTSEAIEQLDVAPGDTVKLELHVFCIDSHRSSPDSTTPFEVAAKRMPKKLRTEINAETKKILKKHKNKVAPAASEIQSHVWKSRDAKWIELEGERANEKSSDDDRPQQRQERRRPRRQK